MVCQAASQTRFRALKHENGSAGKLTIIVRVIACYQPLQDCQVSVKHLMLPLLFNCLRDATNQQFIRKYFCQRIELYIFALIVHGFLFAPCLVAILIHSLFLVLFCRLNTSVICLNLSRRLIPRFCYSIKLEFVVFPFPFLVPKRSSN